MCGHMTKVPYHVGFVPQQSTDKIGDLSIDNHRFCLQVCTTPWDRRLAGLITFSSLLLILITLCCILIHPQLNLIHPCCIKLQYSDQNVISVLRYLGLITKFSRLITKTGKLKVIITLCNTTINVSHSLYGMKW